MSKEEGSTLMRPVRPAAKVLPVTDPEPRWLALDVQPGDPITGRMQHLDGTVREFTGWLGLALELERALGTADLNPTEGTDPC